tara:strand:+ start:526 stop:783 length:258 start_codon:yes stop_codon:yes gene_type:complete
MKRKGYNNIKEQVLEIWAIKDLDLAKQKLLEIVENDLSRVSNSESGKIWKSNFKKTVNRLYTLEQVYMKANDLLMQDNHLTRSRW